MRVLITAGPTREPIDAVRYIGNRSSGRMGAQLARAALARGHEVSLIVGPRVVSMPDGVRRIDIETAAQMHAAVLKEFPSHALLIMAAAVADYRPVSTHSGKLGREKSLTIECEGTPDVVAAAGQIKSAHQRIIGFSLEQAGNLERARDKLARKNLDLIVFNPLQTMESDSVESTLLWRDGRAESLGSCAKAAFADILLARAAELFDWGM